MATSGISSISTDLLAHLRRLYETALNEAASNKHSRVGVNSYTSCAVPAYIIAVTTVEAFINEMFVSPAGRSFFKGNQLEEYWVLVERAELTKKLILLPHAYFGQSLSRGSHLYRDVKILIDLRNDLVHYKMQFEVPKYVKSLQQRHIALNLPNSSWVNNVSTTEGIRWAHNTVCEVIRTTGSLATAESHVLLTSMASHEFFKPIPESVVKDWFTERGIDLDSEEAA